MGAMTAITVEVSKQLAAEASGAFSVASAGLAGTGRLSGAVVRRGALCAHRRNTTPRECGSGGEAPVEQRGRDNGRAPPQSRNACRLAWTNASSRAAASSDA